MELRQGRAYLFLSPLLYREEVVLQVKDAFGLDQLPVLLKADGSPKRTAAVITAVIWTSKKEDKS